MKKLIILVLAIFAIAGCTATTKIQEAKNKVVNKYCETNDELTRQAIRDTLKTFVFSGDGHQVEVKITCQGDVIPD
tara:strand:- start:23136 stop:23363 length:228 start_codon:yes stop_codon:yes gene_type:complete